MKLATAQKNALEIHRRLRSVGGLIGTPNTGSEAVQIKCVWVFGSTVKGKLNPNDLDILVEGTTVGRRYLSFRNQCGRYSKRGIGRLFAKCPIDRASKWMRGGMKMVSLHWACYDSVQPDVKIMLYPRNDFATGLECNSKRL